MIISAKLNVSKIEKDKMFKGREGTYLDITLLSNKGGKDAYGNDGMIVQDLGKEARLAGKRGQILGNYRILDGGAPRAAAQAGPAAPENQEPPETDDVPF
jgi:hypothetical protein